MRDSAAFALSSTANNQVRAQPTKEFIETAFRSVVSVGTSGKQVLIRVPARWSVVRKGLDTDLPRRGLVLTSFASLASIAVNIG